MVFSSIVFCSISCRCSLLTFVVSGFSKHALLVFSLMFYAWGEPVFLPLILAMIALNFWLGRRSNAGTPLGDARLWVTIGIVVNLLPLGIFKYGMFLVQHASRRDWAAGREKCWGICGPDSVRADIPLPLGISFYTFHALSYLIDVYRKDVRAERSVRDLAVYISMFPQLIAGPIIRYKTIAGELHKPVITLDRFATRHPLSS